MSEVFVPRYSPILGFPTSGKTSLSRKLYEEGIIVTDVDYIFKALVPRYFWQQQSGQLEDMPDYRHECYAKVTSHGVFLLNQRMTDYFVTSVSGDVVSAYIPKFPVAFMFRDADTVIRRSQERGDRGGKGFPPKMVEMWLKGNLERAAKVAEHVVLLGPDDYIGSLLVDVSERGLTFNATVVGGKV